MITDNYYNEQKINSVFGYGKISFREYLFLEFSVRNDWSSLLPVDNNSFMYPSVTASAVVTDMFDVDSSVLSFLKIRGGWSEVGGIGALNPYSLDPTFDFRDESWGDTSVAFLPNTGVEFGIDTRLFDNKVRLNVTYYNQTSKDLVVPVQVTAASGYLNAIKNVGEMNNKGIEIQLGASIIDKGDFSFDIDINFAKNKNEVISLGGLESLVLGGQWSMNLEAREGMAYGVIVGSYYERNDEGKVIYEDGLPT